MVALLLLLHQRTDDRFRTNNALKKGQLACVLSQCVLSATLEKKLRVRKWYL